MYDNGKSIGNIIVDCEIISHGSHASSGCIAGYMHRGSQSTGDRISHCNITSHNLVASTACVADHTPARELLPLAIAIQLIAVLSNNLPITEGVATPIAASDLFPKALDVDSQVLEIELVTVTSPHIIWLQVRLAW
jgi:hypothetical protein